MQKKGKITPTPSTPTPLRTSPKSWFSPKTLNYAEDKSRFLRAGGGELNWNSSNDSRQSCKYREPRINPNFRAGRGALNRNSSNESRQSLNNCASTVRLSCSYRATFVQTIIQAHVAPSWFWGACWELFRFAISRVCCGFCTTNVVEQRELSKTNLARGKPFEKKCQAILWLKQIVHPS